jgi:signal transduction histidine kinase
MLLLGIQCVVATEKHKADRRPAPRKKLLPIGYRGGTVPYSLGCILATPHKAGYLLQCSWQGGAARSEIFMKSRSSFVLAVGFGILVVLIGVLGFGAIERARQIYREMEVTQETYLANEAFRRDVSADMYLADILVRDYLLDPSRENAPMHKQQLVAIRASLQSRVDVLTQKIGDADASGLPRLQQEVQAYWDSLDPIFEWTPQQKAELSWSFLRHNVLPHRKAIMDLAREIALANKQNLEQERDRIKNSQIVYRGFLLKMLWFALPFGILVAFITTYRVAALEKRDDEQRHHIEEAEKKLRRLSRSLVQAQELERKALSRELHDEVGQTLTALGMELGKLQKALADYELREQVSEAKQLNSTAMRSIRDLAMGLRPSMLDDLGLEPALQWQGREFSRHTGVPATVQVENLPEGLSDSQRTSVYRIVQEALTNCAKHARASKVNVLVSGKGDRIELQIKDDGVGIHAHPRSDSGLGLLGIEERVQELDGKLKLTSSPGHGTSLQITLPISSEEAQCAKPA